MLADWNKVSEFHQRLRVTAHNEVPHFLWVVMLTGFLVTLVIVVGSGGVGKTTLAAALLD